MMMMMFHAVQALRMWCALPARGTTRARRSQLMNTNTLQFASVGLYTRNFKVESAFVPDRHFRQGHIATPQVSGPHLQRSTPTDAAHATELCSDSQLVPLDQHQQQQQAPQAVRDQRERIDNR